LLFPVLLPFPFSCVSPHTTAGQTNAPQSATRHRLLHRNLSRERDRHRTTHEQRCRLIVLQFVHRDHSGVT
jgi:hypothetical protein